MAISKVLWQSLEGSGSSSQAAAKGQACGHSVVKGQVLWISEFHLFQLEYLEAS
jgi:hypothetical protein